MRFLSASRHGALCKSGSQPNDSDAIDEGHFVAPNFSQKNMVAWLGHEVPLEVSLVVSLMIS